MRSRYMFVQMDRVNVAMFRFLLESYENLAIFTVLEKRPALLKIMYSPNSDSEIKSVLAEIALSIPLKIITPPFAEK